MSYLTFFFLYYLLPFEKAVGGLHGDATSDHPERTLRFAIDTFTVIHDYNITATNPAKQINIRIGLNTGGVGK